MPSDMADELKKYCSSEMNALRDEVRTNRPNTEEYKKYAKLNAAYRFSVWSNEENELWNEAIKLGLVNEYENDNLATAFKNLKDANRKMTEYMPLLNDNKKSLIFRSDLTNIDEIDAEIAKQDNLIKDGSNDKYAEWRKRAYEALRERTEALNAVKALMKKSTTKKKKKPTVPAVETAEIA